MTAVLHDFTIVAPWGEVTLPAAIRARLDWAPGTRLSVEETPEGVLLRFAPPLAEPPEPLFPPTTFDEVVGCLKYDGPPASIEEMDEAVAEMFRRRYGREYDDDDLR